MELEKNDIFLLLHVALRLFISREREVLIASSIPILNFIEIFWAYGGWIWKVFVLMCLDGFETMLHVVKRFVTDLNDVLHGWYGIT